MQVESDSFARRRRSFPFRSRGRRTLSHSSLQDVCKVHGQLLAVQMLLILKIPGKFQSGLYRDCIKLLQVPDEHLVFGPPASCLQKLGEVPQLKAGA